MMPGRMKAHGKKAVGRPRDSQRNVGDKINSDPANHCLKGKHSEVLQIKTSEVSGDATSTPQNVLTFPMLKTIDKEKLLPRYCAILNRSADEGVIMDDLDALQLELETLLSSVVVRSRILQKEVNTLTSKEEKRKRGKFASRLKLASSKRGIDKPIKKLKTSKMQDVDKNPASVKYTKRKNASTKIGSSAKIGRKDRDLQKSSKLDSPRLLHSRYDLPNKFWASVDSYCADITPDNIRFLEELSKECENADEYQNIPPLGRHYSLRWADEDMKSEQDEGRVESKSQSKNGQSESQILLKKGEKACEVSSGPLTQRLVSTLMEENVKLHNPDKLESKNSGGENITPRSGIFRTFVANNNVNFEKRVRKELEDQGILENIGQSKDTSDDEILEEIKRCQSELQTLNGFNQMQLKRLINLAEVQITRQELKRKLNRVDCEVMESYQKVVAAKQKKEILSKTEQDVCWKALRERETLIKQLDRL